MSLTRKKRKVSSISVENTSVLAVFPEDMLKEIYSYLSPLELTELATVDRAHSRLIKDNLIWQRKMQLHFPVVYQKIIDSGRIGINWHGVFVETYQNEYEGLDAVTRRFFSLAKENNPALIEPFKENPDDADLMQVDSIPEIEISYDQLKSADLHSKDENGVTLLDWINRNCSREIQGSVFSLVETRRTEKELAETAEDDSGWTLLNWAAALNQAEIFDEWFDEGQDLELETASGMTALTGAARYGHAELCLRLLAYGVDVNSGHALYYAAQFGLYDICELLLKNGANVDIEFAGGYTPLYIASAKGHHKVAALLLLRGANINSVSPDSSTPLYVAAQNGWDKVVDVLSAHRGVNLESLFQNLYSPLYVASQNNHLLVVRLLLNRGANVNHQTHHGDTPLRVTIANRRWNVMRVLLDNDADPNLAYAGCTPLHWLCIKHHRDPEFLASAKLLIQAGADVFALHNGKTAAQCIARYVGMDEDAIIQGFAEHVDDDEFVMISEGFHFPLSRITKLINKSIAWLQTYLDQCEDTFSYSFIEKTRQKQCLEAFLFAITTASADIEYKILIYAFLLSDKNEVLKHDIATVLGYASISIAKWMLQIDIANIFNVQPTDVLNTFLNQFIIAPIARAISNSGDSAKRGYLSAMVWLTFLGTKEQKISVLDEQLDEVEIDEPPHKRARLASA